MSGLICSGVAIVLAVSGGVLCFRALRRSCPVVSAERCVCLSLQLAISLYILAVLILFNLFPGPGTHGTVQYTAGDPVAKLVFDLRGYTLLMILPLVLLAIWNLVAGSGVASRRDTDVASYGKAVVWIAILTLLTLMAYCSWGLDIWPPV